MTTPTATQTWRALLRDVLDRGQPVEQDSAGAEWRGRTSYELLGYQTTWPMAHAVVLCPERKLGYKFLAAEAAWVLSGSNRLEEIVRFAPALAKMSDDGVHLAGAYGPQFRDQLPYVLGTLTKDAMTRQAVSTIWRPRPMSSRDTPCTISLMWLIRGGAVHCVATMRSSDCFYGVPYDVHTFAMLSAYVALHLRPNLGPLELGDLHLTCGSQHLYKLDREPAARCVWASGPWQGADVSMAVRDEDELFGGIKPIDLADFARPDELIEHLWATARRGGVTYGDYLGETTR